MKNKTCCFLGHRSIEITEDLKELLYESIENLIVKEGVTTFLFGSKSQFNTLCHQAVTEIKLKYPEIKRVFVRAEYPYINDSYKAYLLESYEDTYYPECVFKSGKACYIKRNFEMIDKSQYCIAYFNEFFCHQHYKRKSGTKLALHYARNRKLKIINVYR